jgi:hypothetical protein
VGSRAIAVDFRAFGRLSSTHGPFPCAEYPEWAIPCLQTILIADGISMFDISHHREIYPVRGEHVWAVGVGRLGRRLGPMSAGWCGALCTGQGGGLLGA